MGTFEKWTNFRDIFVIKFSFKVAQTHLKYSSDMKFHFSLSKHLEKEKKKNLNTSIHFYYIINYQVFFFSPQFFSLLYIYIKVKITEPLKEQ